MQPADTILPGVGLKDPEKTRYVVRKVEDRASYGGGGDGGEGVVYATLPSYSRPKLTGHEDLPLLTETTPPPLTRLRMEIIDYASTFLMLPFLLAYSRQKENKRDNRHTDVFLIKRKYK